MEDPELVKRFLGMQKKLKKDFALDVYARDIFIICDEEKQVGACRSIGELQGFINGLDIVSER